MVLWCGAHLAIHVHKYGLDEVQTIAQLLLLLGPLLGRLDQRLDQQRGLGDPRGHGQDALGDPHLPEQGVVGALLHELLEPPVRLQDVLVDGDSVRVLGAEGPVGRLPAGGALLAAELRHENVRDGGDDRGGVLGRENESLVCRACAARCSFSGYSVRSPASQPPSGCN